ncbi:hypothetical protein ACKVWC_011589 [Pyricularia oryzae]
MTVTIRHAGLVAILHQPQIPTGRGPRRHRLLELPHARHPDDGAADGLLPHTPAHRHAGVDRQAAPLPQRVLDGDLLEPLAAAGGALLAQRHASGAQALGRRVPALLGPGRDAGRQQAHGEDAGVEDDVDAGAAEARQGFGGGEDGVLHGKVRVAEDGVDGAARGGGDGLGELQQAGHGVARDADVADQALGLEGAEGAEPGQDVGRGDELDVVEVRQVEVGGAQALEAAVDGGGDGGGRVVKRRGADAPGLADEEVRVAGPGGGGERVAQEELGGAVVGRCVKGADAQVEGAGDDGASRHRGRVSDVLGVEGGGAEDHGREDGGEGRAVATAVY